MKYNISDYSDNFEVIYESNRWVIHITSSLNDTTLKGYSELVMTLTASQAESENTGETVLILKLPTINNETGPKFSKAYYTADYPKEGTGVIEFEPTLEFSNIDNMQNIIIALDSK